MRCVEGVIMRAFILALSVSFAFPAYALSVSSATKAPAATTLQAQIMKLLGSEAPIIDAACCKVCRKGQACGDSCISRSYTCHVGPGCACQGR
jgi:hypothetical protein